MATFRHVFICLAASAVLTGCGGGGSGLFGGRSGNGDAGGAAREPAQFPMNELERREAEQKSILDLFRNTADPNVTVAVNKYIWQASLEILNFLPVEAADPFSGVIVMGWGRAPGSGRQYRATVYVQDPALDARSLKVALMTRSGPADRDTVRAVEDAILTRARQLRIRDGNL